ncbi:hypothetical protein NY2A_b384L [Paramecium bursaria Chlorella virus NY2A]|uniref:Uncharacterized protein b384L n=1 Tax=Paramecium bursaria Chlorella virus NY2A TaxID=46021 RepID=A7IWQ9_PBCVN|nr:hypothetical protein NY2A_b384L [Paramecium bursaria Chlorella virus NY2A]ABT14783.1 hypothetical protein NY2A_b384L [Paramecium bursaria Chlorella virus NY2A]
MRIERSSAATSEISSATLTSLFPSSVIFRCCAISPVCKSNTAFVPNPLIGYNDGATKFTLLYDILNTAPFMCSAKSMIAIDLSTGTFIENVLHVYTEFPLLKILGVNTSVFLNVLFGRSIVGPEDVTIFITLIVEPDWMFNISFI